MKPTSFKEIETYLYTSIILRLKGLNVRELRYPSPLVGADGLTWELRVEQTPVRQNYRRNYQRTQAERRRNFWVVLKIEGGRRLVLGEYNIKSHIVKLFQSAFAEVGASPLMGKMADVFQTNTPFTKVVVDSGEYPEYSREGFTMPTGLRRPMATLGDYDQNDDYEDDEPEPAVRVPF